jgi:hypothetical protein
MMNRRQANLAAWAGLGGAVSGLAAEPHPKEKTCALAGTPLDEMHPYLCAFHVAKEDPKLQVEAHHYCMAVRDDLFQCVVLESNKPKARILGIEYIVTDALYRKLSDAEKKVWHPHTRRSHPVCWSRPTPVRRKRRN